MNLRKTVSVTPAIGASTVAGEIVTDPSRKDEGTTARRARTPGSKKLRSAIDLSQNFFTLYILPTC